MCQLYCQTTCTVSITSDPLKSIIIILFSLNFQNFGAASSVLLEVIYIFSRLVIRPIALNLEQIHLTRGILRLLFENVTNILF